VTAAMLLPVPRATLVEALAAAAVLALIVGITVALVPARPRYRQWVAHRRVRAPAALGAAGAGPRDRRAGRLLETVARPLLDGPGAVGLARLRQPLRRAGISTPPDLWLAAVVAGTLAVAVLAVAAVMLGWLGLPLVTAGLLPGAVPLLAGAEVVRRGRLRRLVLHGQLPLLAELVVLEQTAGGLGLRSALERVVQHVGGPASDCLRECLIASAGVGTPPLDAWIDGAAAEQGLPALAVLATVVRLQRTEGMTAAHPLRQLAATLRDEQRDTLLAHGKRAVIQMLIPMGVCILLPFITLILFPAFVRIGGALQ